MHVDVCAGLRRGVDGIQRRGDAWAIALHAGSIIFRASTQTPLAGAVILIRDGNLSAHAAQAGVSRTLPIADFIFYDAMARRRSRCVSLGVEHGASASDAAGC